MPFIMLYYRYGDIDNVLAEKLFLCCRHPASSPHKIAHRHKHQPGMMVAAAMVSVAVSLLASAFAAFLLRLPRERWGVFVAMAGLSNTIFIGIPVCTQLFGEASVHSEILPSTHFPITICGSPPFI